MHGDAGAGAEEGVELVLALRAAGQPSPPLSQQSQVRVAEVPAARPLQQVAADRGHVPQLRRGGDGGRLGQGGVARLEQRGSLDLGQRGQRAQGDAAGAVRVDPGGEPCQALDVDQPVRGGEVGLHQGEQVGAAGQGAGPAVFLAAPAPGGSRVRASSIEVGDA